MFLFPYWISLQRFSESSGDYKIFSCEFHIQVLNNIFTKAVQVFYNHLDLSHQGRFRTAAIVKWTEGCSSIPNATCKTAYPGTFTATYMMKASLRTADDAVVTVESEPAPRSSAQCTRTSYNSRLVISTGHC